MANPEGFLTRLRPGLVIIIGLLDLCCNIMPNSLRLTAFPRRGFAGINQGAYHLARGMYFTRPYSESRE